MRGGAEDGSELDLGLGALVEERAVCDLPEHDQAAAAAGLELYGQPARVQVVLREEGSDVVDSVVVATEARAALSTPDLSGRVTEVRLWQNRTPEDEPAEDKGSR